MKKGKYEKNKNNAQHLEGFKPALSWLCARALPLCNRYCSQTIANYFKGLKQTYSVTRRSSKLQITPCTSVHPDSLHL